jgi:ADP-heptose:LPS heptosyltransferase
MIITLGSGLGDILTVIHSTNCYTQLEDIPDTERVRINLTSPNPFVKELFLWHPRASQFEIKEFGYFFDDDKQSMRKQLGIEPSSPPFKSVNTRDIRFYSSPSDKDVLAKLDGKKFVAVFSSAGSDGRFFPSEICQSIVDAVGGTAMTMVAGGRNYEPKYPIKAMKVRAEWRPPEKDFVVDLVDQLSVPGSIELLRRSAAVIATHSSMCLMAWYLKKPVFLLYPKSYGDNRRNHAAFYWFGAKVGPNVDTSFEEYQPEMLKHFLSGL